MSNELTESTSYSSVKKLILLSFLFFIVPFLGFLFLKTEYDPSILYKLEGLHTISILVMSVLALLVAFFGYTIFAGSTDIRIMFIVFAFFSFGAIFAMHALSLPSLAISSQDFFEITEHYSLLFVSLLVFIGASIPATASSSATYNKRLYLFIATQVLILLFFIIAFNVPRITTLLAQTIDAPIILTGILFIGALAKLFQQYATDHNKFILSIILGISVILNTVVIPFTYQEWDLLWWYFHFILALSFAVASFGMLTIWLKEVKKRSPKRQTNRRD